MAGRVPPHPRGDEVTVDQVLHALADPIRRNVLHRIATDGPQYCGDLEYGVSKSTMSHHFKVLREAGLLHTEVQGTRRIVTRRDDLIEMAFPGLLAALDLPRGTGSWQETV